MMLKNSKEGINIRRACISDINDIIKEWRLAYPEEIEYKFPERWTWQFKNNPSFAYAHHELLPIWIAKEGKNIVGWSCAMIVEARIIDNELPIAFSVDTYVKSSHRRRMIGLRLQEQLQKKNVVFMSIQMSEGNRRIKHKIGGENGKSLRIFFRLLGNLDGVLLHKSLTYNTKLFGLKKIVSIAHQIFGGHEFKLVSRIISSLLKYKQKLNTKATCVHNSRTSLHFEKISTFGDEASLLWDKYKKNFGFSVIRDQEYLNWKYVQQPQLYYLKYYVKDKSQIVGLLIFRLGQPPELKVGVIAEMIAFNNESWVYRDMINFAEHSLRLMGALSIRCGSSINELDTLLEAAGYNLMEIKMPVIHIDRSKLYIDLDELKKIPWLLSLGDQDMDIPILNQQPSLGNIIGTLLGKIQGQQFIGMDR